MRQLVPLVASLLALGCSRPTGHAAAVEPAEGARAIAALSAAKPSTIVYTAVTPPSEASEGSDANGARAGSARVRSRVAAVAEDGSRQAVVLSPAGTDGKFVAALPDGRVVYSTLAPDGTIAALASVHVDGSDVRALGSFEAGRYTHAEAHAVESAVVVELLRRDRADTTDVYALREGEPPVRLAEQASFVAAESSRVALLVGPDAPHGTGDLVAIGLDGKNRKVLGGGDGQDVLGAVAGSRIVVTSHASAAGDVRIVDLARATATTFGAKGADERAFGFAGDRVVFTRTTRGPIALLSAAADGSAERLLAAPEGSAEPLAIVNDDAVLFGDGSARGGVFSATVADGTTRTIDADAGTRVRVFGTVGERVVYTAACRNGWTLRAAKLDGSGVTVLYEKPSMHPFVVATTGDRVVFRAAPASKPDAGRLASVRLDGTDLRTVGHDVYHPDGARRRARSREQDFFAVTPAGRLILEVGYEGSSGSQIVASAPRLASALELSELGRVWFGAVVP